MPRRRLVLAVLFTAEVLVMLDGIVVSVALPEIGAVLGWMSATIDVGMVGGAVLGGLITYAFGWPWVFLALVPVALSAAAVTPALLPESRDERTGGGLDWAGAATVAGGSRS